MYGLPWWKYLPQNFSPVFTKLIQHKDRLQERIGHIVDQSLAHEKNDSEEKLSILDNLISNPDIRYDDCISQEVVKGDLKMLHIFSHAHVTSKQMQHNKRHNYLPQSRIKPFYLV